ncbi:hypothetical protein [Ochrobactrum sp. CGA5]|uniref:hypothetical protein n=1 Tax=Ochrobactrum sp. CGA5 TaxID=2583453 RepID=UPI00111F8DB3|nr:hypothetical protein [Ochrobactrum sp. CGA5]
MPALHIDIEAIDTINNRIRPSVGTIYDGETYWPRRLLEQPHETVLPSLNGLARLIASDGNFLEDVYLGERYSRKAGFFGTAHMKARIIDTIGLLSLREAGVIEVNGFSPDFYLDGGLLGIFRLLEHVWNDPSSISVVGADREDEIVKDQFNAVYQAINRSVNDITDLTVTNITLLFDYANDYRNSALDYLGEILQKSDREIWCNLGDLIGIEAGTHNLTLVVDGGILRQRAQLVFEAH